MKGVKMFKVKKKYDDIIIIIYGVNKNDVGNIQFLTYNDFLTNGNGF